MMAIYGLLIDYNYCSGCRTCEVACQLEHHYEPGVQGLFLTAIGPFPLPDGKWQYDNIPMHTPFCNHCSERVKKGKIPACVHNCQAGCITFGEIEDLVKQITSDRMALFTL